MSNLLQLLKKLPIDVGQGELRYETAGKKIAFTFVPSRTSSEAAAAIDIGNRDDFWSARLREKGYTMTGIDKETGTDVEEGLRYSDSSFDVVWSTEVIEHLYEPKFFLDEIDRILKPHGVAVLTTPNSHWWLYYILRIFGQTPKKVQNPDHKQFFSLTSLKAIAPDYDIYGYFPYIFMFFKISKGISLLSPTFILVKKKHHS